MYVTIMLELDIHSDDNLLYYINLKHSLYKEVMFAMEIIPEIAPLF